MHQIILIHNCFQKGWGKHMRPWNPPNKEAGCIQNILPQCTKNVPHRLQGCMGIPAILWGAGGRGGSIPHPHPGGWGHPPSRLSCAALCSAPLFRNHLVSWEQNVSPISPPMKRQCKSDVIWGLKVPFCSCDGRGCPPRGQQMPCVGLAACGAPGKGDW